MLLNLKYKFGSFKSKIDACEQIIAWEQIYQAKTIDGNSAQIVQNEDGPQLFYTVKCRQDRENLPCHGINSGIQSRCETRFNAVAALIFDELSPNGFRWDMVMIPGQCTCIFVNGTHIL
uniref:Spaetzle domain-containing protein n=1 Tax=Panagrolaimus davidi TaxID=227884 RepID=A0A914Q7W9_9BILA